MKINDQNCKKNNHGIIIHNPKANTIIVSPQL